MSACKHLPSMEREQEDDYTIWYKAQCARCQENIWPSFPVHNRRHDEGGHYSVFMHAWVAWILTLEHHQDWTPPQALEAILNSTGPEAPEWVRKLRGE